MNVITRDDFTELLQKAKLKPRLKKELRFVPEEITNWDNRDFLAVMNRSKSEGVLVVPFTQPNIVPFQLHVRRPGKTGRTEAIICDFCKTWQRGSNSAIITFEREKSTQSLLVCGDLDCSLHVRNITEASKISRTQLRENMTVEQRVERLRNCLESIVATIVAD